MAANTLAAKQHAHELLEQLGPGQLAAVVNLLEVMIHEDDEELTEEDRRAISASREYFRLNPERHRNGDGIETGHRNGIETGHRNGIQTVTVPTGTILKRQERSRVAGGQAGE